ncbi:hypothetical protein LCGC14_1041490 [marine sediment metagenome]|uniref:Uncharacterized protein n=1 Tax=marine sediment metagenome TaxID=412755 RepID=A0A0F9NDB6_9ZZZZ
MSNRLVCRICGSEKEIPTCCDRSMLVKDDYLLCCCSVECEHKPLPECCDQKMDYLFV